MNNLYSQMFKQWFLTTEMTMGALMLVSNKMAKAWDEALHQQVNVANSLLFGSLRDLNESLQAVNPELQGQRRVALVTGGIGGIGSAICGRFLREGYRVVATYIAAERDKAIQWRKDYQSAGYEIEIVECDVTDYDACAKVVETIVEDYATIDVLVNGAGITRDGTLRKMEQNDWRAVLTTNLDSVFNMTRNVIDHMIDNGYGRVISISSVNGLKGQFGQTNYATAKAGMIGFSKSLAREVAEYGITVNTLSPGYVATPMVMAVPEEIREHIVGKIPMGRLAEPQEIAQVVAFLADEKTTYITGTDISVNGGLLMV